ncbi:T9SS type A sorting domain-containing protein [bacterium]|nr:T9SS type A sorting domain-containing protein [bacterium]
MIRILSLLLLCSLSAFAQWSSSPSENLLICDHSSEQVVPKIAATSDGGCYITWWDLSSGNYDVWLQKLDTDGVPEWTVPCGNHISDYPQDTWLTDWDMTVDLDDHCIIAVNDIRSGSDRDITAYRMSPDGEFVWGEGLAISNNDGFEPDPRIAIAENGDIVFAWQEEDSIHLRRVTTEGADVFTPATLTITATNGVSIPRICAADSNSVILSYLIHQGTQFTSPRHIYMQKFDMNGAMLWNPSGIAVMTTNGIGIQMKPDLVHDGQGGAYSYWYDTRNNVHHCYVQRINSAGITQWTTNGVNVDLSANELQMSPSAVNTGFGVVIFYQTANTNQSQGGVDAQYLSPTGQLNWNSNGVTVAALSPEPCFNVKAYVQNGNYSVFYSQYAQGSAINTFLRASQLGEAGQSTWSPTISDLCNVNSEKGRPYTCINSFHQIIAAWPDSRSAVMDIYVQNVNSGGTLGPLADLPPSISITFPADFDTVHNDTISLVFDVDHFDLDPNSGDGSVRVIVNSHVVDTLFSEDPYSVESLPGENQIYVSLLDEDFIPLDPVVTDFVVFYYPPLNPSITITWPSQPPDTLFWSNDAFPYIHFEVEDFVVADSAGDGRIHSQVRDYWQNALFDSSTRVVFDSIEVPLAYFTTDEVVLSLVDYEGNPLNPPVADTVYINAWQIAADPNDILLPSSFILSAYPNPFNSTVTIEYQVPAPSLVSLDVFDLLGRKVASLLNEQQSSGTHSHIWNADNFSSGVYLLRLNSGTTMRTQKILLLK